MPVGTSNHNAVISSALDSIRAEAQTLTQLRRQNDGRDAMRKLHPKGKQSTSSSSDQGQPPPAVPQQAWGPDSSAAAAILSGLVPASGALTKVLNGAQQEASQVKHLETRLKNERAATRALEVALGQAQQRLRLQDSLTARVNTVKGEKMMVSAAELVELETRDLRKELLFLTDKATQFKIARDEAIEQATSAHKELNRNQSLLKSAEEKIKIMENDASTLQNIKKISKKEKRQQLQRDAEANLPSSRVPGENPSLDVLEAALTASREHCDSLAKRNAHVESLLAEKSKESTRVSETLGKALKILRQQQIAFGNEIKESKRFHEEVGEAMESSAKSIDVALLHADAFREHMHNARDMDIQLMEEEFSDVLDEVKNKSAENVSLAKTQLQSVFRRKIVSSFIDPKVHSLQAVQVPQVCSKRMENKRQKEWPERFVWLSFGDGQQPSICWSAKRPPLAKQAANGMRASTISAIGDGNYVNDRPSLESIAGDQSVIPARDASGIRSIKLRSLLSIDYCRQGFHVADRLIHEEEKPKYKRKWFKKQATPGVAVSSNPFWCTFTVTTGERPYSFRCPDVATAEHFVLAVSVLHPNLVGAVRSRRELLLRRAHLKIDLVARRLGFKSRVAYLLSCVMDSAEDPTIRTKTMVAKDVVNVFHKTVPGAHLERKEEASEDSGFQTPSWSEQSQDHHHHHHHHHHHDHDQPAPPPPPPPAPAPPAPPAAAPAPPPAPKQPEPPQRASTSRGSGFVKYEGRARPGSPRWFRQKLTGKK